MREELKRKENEPSEEWIGRICDNYHIGKEIFLVMCTIYDAGYNEGFGEGMEYESSKE